MIHSLAMIPNKTKYIFSLFMFYAMYAIVVPYFQIFLYGKGLSHSVTGTIIGVWEVAGIAGPLLLGAIVDRTGKFRTVLLLCTLVGSVILFVMLKTQLLFLLFLFTALFGFLFKPILPLNDSMISHNLPDPEHDYGHVRAAGSIGFVAVMIFITITGVFNSPTPTMIAWGTLFLGAAYAVSIFFLPSAAPVVQADRKGRGWINKKNSEGKTITTQYIIMIVVVFLGRFGFSSYYSFFSIFLQEEMHVANIGLFWLIATSAEIFPIMFAGRIIRGTGRFLAIVLGVGAMAVRIFVFSSTDSLIVIGFIQLLHGLTFGVLHAACISFINAKIAPENKTLAISIYMSVGWGLAAILGSPLGGLLIESVGFSRMFRIMAIFPVLGVLLLAGYRLLSQRKGSDAF